MRGTAQITLVAVAATSMFGFAFGQAGPRNGLEVNTAGTTSFEDTPIERVAPRRQTRRPEPDLSGDTREGVASFYNLPGRTMANGAPMDPDGNNAASRTLPLGTVARVTNLETGKSALITIQDRGPYVKGRIVDLSPATARRIGISARQGVGRVVVAPISVPLPDGSVKVGAAVRDFSATREIG